MSQDNEQPMGTRTFGHIDFTQEQVHESLGVYLSEYIRTLNNEDLAVALDAEDRGVFFSFIWHPGVENSFLRIVTQDKPIDAQTSAPEDTVESVEDTPEE